MPITQAEIDGLYREMLSDPAYTSADRQSQEVLARRFQDEIGSPTALSGTAFQGQPGMLERFGPTALRIGGTIGGFALGGPPGGAIGAGLGDIAAQAAEVGMGQRQGYNPIRTGAEAVTGFIGLPGKLAGATRLARVGMRAGQGAALGAGQTTAAALSEGQLPTAGELGASAVLGGAFSGLVGGLEKARDVVPEIVAVKAPPKAEVKAPVEPTVKAQLALPETGTVKRPIESPGEIAPISMREKAAKIDLSMGDLEIHGGERPAMMPRATPPSTTGRIEFDPVSDGFVVEAPRVQGERGVAGAATNVEEATRATAPPRIAAMTSSMRAIREADELVLTDIGKDAEFFATAGDTVVADWAREGLQILPGKRSERLGLMTINSNRILRASGTAGREFAQRADEARQVGEQIYERMYGGTGLRAFLKRRWDNATQDQFIDAYQAGAVAKGREMSRTVQLAKDVLAGQDNQNELAGFVTHRRTTLPDGTEKVDIVPYSRRPNFLPAMPNPKAIAHKLHKKGAAEEVAAKYGMKESSVRRLWSDMLKMDENGVVKELRDVSDPEAVVIARTLNPQGSQMYRDFGFVADMRVAIPLYLRQMARKQSMLAGFGGMDPQSVQAAFQAAKAGDPAALKALTTRSKLPLIEQLRSRMIRDGGHGSMLVPAMNAMLGRSSIPDGDKWFLKATSAYMVGTKLGFSSIMNLSEIGVIASKFGWTNTLAQAGKLSARVATRKGRLYGPEAWDAAVISYAETLQENFRDAPYMFTKQFLKYTGMTPGDIALRTIAMSLSKPYVKGLLEEAATTRSGKYLSELKRLGVNTDELLSKGSIPELAVERAWRNMSEQLILTNRPGNLPPSWSQTVFGRLLTLFQGWPKHASERLNRSVRRDPWFAAKMVAYGIPTGYAFDAARRKVSEVVTWRDPRIEEKRPFWWLYSIGIAGNILGWYASAIALTHPNPSMAERTLQGLVFDTFNKFTGAALSGMGRYLTSQPEERDISMVAYPFAKWLRRSTYGTPVPAIGWATQRLEESLRPPSQSNPLNFNPASNILSLPEAP